MESAIRPDWTMVTCFNRVKIPRSIKDGVFYLEYLAGLVAVIF